MPILLITGDVLTTFEGIISTAIFAVIFEIIHSLHNSFQDNFKERKDRLLPEINKMIVRNLDIFDMIGDPFLRKDSNEGKQIERLKLFKRALKDEGKFYIRIMLSLCLCFVISLLLVYFVYANLGYLTIITSILLTMSCIVITLKYRTLWILNDCLCAEITISTKEKSKSYLFAKETEIRATEYYTKTKHSKLGSRKGSRAIIEDTSEHIPLQI